MKESKFIDSYITCPKHKKTFQLTKGQKTCPYCGELLTEESHAVDYLRTRRRARRTA